jgi:hypothetical protein
MIHYRLRLFAIGAIATLAGITQAAAGCCPVPVTTCGCGPVFAPAVMAVPVPEMYVVNQGPVYSGPGPYVTQRNYIEGDQVAAIGYPYVGYVPAPTVPRRFYYGGGYRRVVGGPYLGRPYINPWRRGFVRPAGIRVYGPGPRPGRVLYGPRVSGVRPLR